MASEDQTDHMNEEEEFFTPQIKNKKQKKRKEETATETENHDQGKTITVKVKQIYERPDRISPIVAYFSTGYNPCALHPETGEKQTPKVTVYRHKDESKKRLKVVVSPPGANVEFVGTNYTGEQAAMQTTTNMLGVFNRETKTLRILPVAGNKIIRLEPVIKSQEAIDSESTLITGEPSKGEPSKGARPQAGIYDSKKTIRRDKKRRALSMGDDDAENQKVLGGKLNEADANTAALESTVSTVARNIPPYNASATTPKEAYPLEKIIDMGEWNFLEDIYRLLQQETSAATDAYPVFVRNRLYKLQDIEDDTEKKTVCGVLTLLTHLVKFKDKNSMNGFDSSKDHRFPIIIRQKCQSLFEDPESERIPVGKADLLISYVLVLALHVDNFKTDPEDIAKDLRISPFELRKHFENLGCKFSKEKSTLVATLPTPLKFPQIRKRRKTQR